MANINDLLKDMNNFEISPLCLSENNLTFSKVEIFDESLLAVKPGILYIVTAKQFWNKINNMEKAGGIYFVVADKKNNYVENSGKKTVVLINMVPNIETLYYYCVRWLENYTYYLESTAELFDVLSCSSSEQLKRLVNVSADVLKNPVIILDANWKIMETSEIYIVEDEIWSQNIIRGYCTYEQVMELNEMLKKKDETTNAKAFQIVSLDVYQNRLCISPLETDSERMGTLVIFESSMPFSRLNQRLLYRINQLATNIIYNDYERAKTLNEYSEDNIFIERLSGSLKSYGNYCERIRHTPFAKPSFYRVVLLNVEKFENFDPRKETLRQYFLQLFKRSWMLWYEGNVVAIIDVNDVDFETILNREEEYFVSKRLKLGISDVFEDIYYIEKYYRQGLTALELAAKLSPGEIFSYYDKYKFYDMCKTFIGYQNMQTFFDTNFVRIQKYDQMKNTEYLQTIEAFLLTGKNLSKTAELLHIHKNTVSYRIGKIKEIFHLSCDDMEEIFGLLCSFKMKQILDNFPNFSSGDEANKDIDFIC